MTNQCETPTVSIVSVCLNEPPERIAYTLTSIDQQTYPRIAKVVIDGGSRAETVRAIRARCRSVDQFVSDIDSGIYDAMNKGLRYATGQFVIFMNMGDRFTNATVVERMVSCASAHPECAWFFGDYWRVSSGARTLVRLSRRPSRFGLYCASICHQTVMARRSLFEQGGGFDTSYRLMADQQWLLRVSKYGRGLHTGLVTCEFAEGGACGDTVLLNAEWARLRKEEFGCLEQPAFCVGRLALRAARRLRTADYRVPVALTAR